MPRVWLLYFVVIASSLPAAARAQNGYEGQQSRVRTTQDYTQSLPSEPSSTANQGPAKRAITPQSQSGEAAERKTASNGKPASAVGSLWTTIGSLAFIVITILVVARTWKKHGPRISGGIPPEAVEVLGKRPLDQRQSLHLVRLGSKILLLGSSADGLRTLAEVTDPVDVDYLAGLCRQGDADGTAAQTFRALFNRNLPEKKSSRAQARERGRAFDNRAESGRNDLPHHDMEEAHG